MARDNKEIEAYYTHLATTLPTVAHINNGLGHLVGIIVREDEYRFVVLLVDQYRLASGTHYFRAVAESTLDCAIRTALSFGWDYHYSLVEEN